MIDWGQARRLGGMGCNRRDETHDDGPFEDAVGFGVHREGMIWTATVEPTAV